MNPEFGDGRGPRRDEKIAIIVALALGIPLVLLLFWLRGLLPWVGSPNPVPSQSPPQGLREAGSPKPAAVLSSLAPAGGAAPAGSQQLPASGKIAELEVENRQMTARLAELEAELADRPRKAEPKGEQENGERQRRENEALLQEVQELRKEFAGAKLLYAKLVRESLTREQQQNAEVQALQGELERSRTENGTLKAEWERLRGEVAQLRQDQETMKKVQSELQAEKQKERQLQDAFKRKDSELADLKARLDAATAGMKAADPGPALEALKAEKTALQAEVESLRKKLQQAEKPSPTGMVPPPPVDAKEPPPRPVSPKKEIPPQTQTGPGARPPLKARVIDQRQSGQLPVEAQGPADLWQGAVPLYHFLRQAAQEKIRVAERDETASAKNMGRLVAQVNFAKNRCEVDKLEESKLESLLSQQGKEGYYLVVGYASLSGCTRQNDVLSKRRAEAVAASVTKHLEADAQLQTIYLGETDQFDSEREEKNRVVEIWRVGP